MNIVLLEPEIPENTGNIGRTCVASNTRLHLIRPFGFILNERGLKRAGMDYWDRLDVSDYVNYDDFIHRNKDAKIWYATTKAGRTYADVSFGMDDFIMFGKESAGIPEDILKANRTRCIRIPMFEDERSLNLANSVAVILYEALRQNDFEGLKVSGGRFF
ncbi:MAG: tRNA (cytidine(34)-2'-O)-methyltransferase [Lachnospiraceae bacterium]|nr:tRNA (cytidine(34)-2'-O)-methyltransferase [Lachnospiraceae bacterium]